MTKLTRIRPVTAITAFFPIEVLQRVIAPLALISAPRLCVLPRVRLHPVLVEGAAVGVVDYHHREVFHLQATDGLRPQFRVGDDLELLHEAREHRARAADRAEVHGLVQLEGLLDRLGARALADRALETELEERGRELVHPPAGGRPDRANDVARARRRRARVVDDLAAHLDRELLATLDQRKEAPVSGVARRVEDARDPHAIAGPQ